jgi:hypothetical protein
MRTFCMRARNAARGAALAHNNAASHAERGSLMRRGSSAHASCISGRSLNFRGGAVSENERSIMTTDEVAECLGVKHRIAIYQLVSEGNSTPSRWEDAGAFTGVEAPFKVGDC